MVKAYLRYEKNGAVGSITSAAALAFVPASHRGRDGVVGGSTSKSGSGTGPGTELLASRHECAAVYNTRTQQATQLLRIGAAPGYEEGIADEGRAPAAVLCMAVFGGNREDEPAHDGDDMTTTDVAAAASGLGMGGDLNGMQVCIGDSHGYLTLWNKRDEEDVLPTAMYVERARVLCQPKTSAMGMSRKVKGVLCCSFSPTGEMVAAGSGDGGVSIIDTVLGRCECRLKGHTGAVEAVEFVTGAQLLRDAQRRSAGEITATSISRHRDGTSSGGIGLDIQSRFSFAVSASRDGTVRCWDVAARHCVQVLVLGVLSTGSGIAQVSSDDAEQLANVMGDANGRGNECVGMVLGEMGGGGPMHAVVAGSNGDATVIEVAGGAPKTHSAEQGMDANLDPKILQPVPGFTLGKRRNAAEHKISCVTYLRALPTPATAGKENVTSSSWIAIAYGRNVEIWRACAPDEVKKRTKRRLKRRREKASQSEKARGAKTPQKKRKLKDGGDKDPTEISDRPEAAAEEIEDDADEADIGDMYQHVASIRVKGKTRALSLQFLDRSRVSIAVATANNQIEVHEVARDKSSARKADANAGEWAVSMSYCMQRGGHRTAVRTVCISRDDSLIASCCNGSMLIWDSHNMCESRSLAEGEEGMNDGNGGDDVMNTSSGLLRSVHDVGYAVSSVFLPDNRHIVVGDKSGAISIVDGATGFCVGKMEDAHEGGAVWDLAVALGKSGYDGDSMRIISGGEDKYLKVWKLAAAGQGSSGGGKSSKASTEDSVELELERSLLLSDDILSIKVSPDEKFIAVALLDSTIKLFFLDTLKFFVSMYGHSLPALSIDVSSDGMLLASGGGDKNLRIWGMEFGDCHRSLRAHDDTITRVSFVPNTHYILTCSKDRNVKYWDGDRFEHLLTLEGNHAEVWCMAVSSNGGFFVTGGADRSVRRWDRTTEPFFLEEERERRFDAMFEAETQQAVQPLDVENGGMDAAMRTGGTLTAADAIIDALEVAEEEIQRRRMISSGDLAASAGTSQNPLLLGASPLAHVMKALKAVKPSELEQVLMCLPFPMALQLLHYLTRALKTTNVNIESLIRSVILLLRLHAAPLTSAATTSLGEDARGTGVAHGGSAAILRRLAEVLRPKVEQLKHMMGFNLAGLATLERSLVAANDAPFSDAAQRLRKIMEDKKKVAREKAIGVGARRKNKQRKEADDRM